MLKVGVCVTYDVVRFNEYVRLAQDETYASGYSTKPKGDSK